MMNLNEIIAILKQNANPKNVEGMARFGINSNNTFGISMPIIRQLAKDIKKNHELALELWETGFHEARILAALIDNPKQVKEVQLEKWVLDFDSWDVCDQCIMNLFDKTPYAYDKAHEWSHREDEFVKRAGFAMMASLSCHDKKADNSKFDEFFPLIFEASEDERNFVKKAVNWALRQIGKRNFYLNKKAILLSEKILEVKKNSKSARWIANDAIRELTNEKTLNRIKY